MKTATQKAASRPGLGLGEGVLADRQWLDAHLLDPRVRVVEVDVSPVAYDDWHIDGAVLWNVYTDLKDAGYRTVGAAALQRLVARSGIGPDSTVVFYGYAPAPGLWLMKLHGHRDVRILDCSRDTWRAGGHPRGTATSELPADGYRLDGEDHRVRADRVAVQDAIGRPGTTLVDVRSAAEYRGDCFWPSGGMEPGGRAGHVPSAVHQAIHQAARPLPDATRRARHDPRTCARDHQPSRWNSRAWASCGRQQLSEFLVSSMPRLSRM